VRRRLRPGAQLAAWLRDRPNRRSDFDKTIGDIKQRDAQLAEKMQANFAKAEEQTEKALRQLAERSKTQPPAVQERRQKERQETEACIRYLEGELARLSPDDLKADAYIAPPGRRRLPNKGCSSVVEGGSPDAMRIVAVNFQLLRPDAAARRAPADRRRFLQFRVRQLSPFGMARDRYESLREGMDYGALADLLPKR